MGLIEFSNAITWVHPVHQSAGALPNIVQKGVYFYLVGHMAVFCLQAIWRSMAQFILYLDQALLCCGVSKIITILLEKNRKYCKDFLLSKMNQKIYYPSQHLAPHFKIHPQILDL